MLAGVPCPDKPRARGARSVVRRLPALSVVLAAVAGAAGPLALGASPADRIVYTTLQDYNHDIYLRATPDAEWQRLTTDQANDYNPTFSPDGRWLVFCSERRGNPDLFALDLERGGLPRPLTSSRTMEDAPEFSPDGRRLAFVSDRHGDADIFVMAFDPDDPRGDERAVNLTSSTGGDFNPVFSPDGATIAFTSERHLPHTEIAYWQLVSRLGHGGDIYRMASDGTDVRRLTTTVAWDGAPAWSADGRSLYFYSDRDRSTRIWRMAADGSDQRPLTPVELDGAVSATPAGDGRVLFAAGGSLHSMGPAGESLRQESTGEPALAAPAVHLATGRVAAHGPGPLEGRIDRPSGRPFAATGTLQEIDLPDRTVRVEGLYGGFPAFAPGGLRLVTSQAVPGAVGSGRRALVVSKPDGSDPVQIHETEGQIFAIDWSPDGEWIAWSEGVVFAPEGVRVDLWRIRPDGSGLENLTDSPTNDAFPKFAGDGRIVFRSGRDGNKEIYLMAGDGSDPKRLTNHPGVDTMPAIAPDGSFVVYATDQLDWTGSSDIDLARLQLAPSGEPGAAFQAWMPGHGPAVHGPGPDVHPSFSPDGRWIVYASARGGLNDEPALFDGGPQPYGEIWVQSFPFGRPIRLTHNKWEDSLADWATGD